MNYVDKAKAIHQQFGGAKGIEAEMLRRMHVEADATIAQLLEALEECAEQLRHLAAALNAVPSSQIANCVAKADAAISAAKGEA